MMNICKISMKSVKNGMIIKRKSAFFLCFLPFWETPWWFSKKFLATVLAFLQGLYLASSAFKDYTKSLLTIVLGLGKNNVPAKKQIGAKKAIWKKRFFRYYAKIAADTGFRNAALEQRKNTTNNKKSKLFKMLYCSFCHFSSIFGHLSEIFWIIAITFFILITSASNLVGCCRTQMWICTATFSFFCVWCQRYILHVENDQNSPKKSTNLFLYFAKNLHNSCITIFTNFGSWPTFSVTNGFF